MPRGSRPVVLLCLVLLVLTAGAGIAVAGWQTSGPGNSTARAGAIAVPANPVAGTPTCSGTNAQVTFDWPDVTGATSYPVEIATNATFTQGRQTGTVTASMATVTAANATTQRTFHFRVRAVAGQWTSGNSATTTANVGPCR